MFNVHANVINNIFASEYCVSAMKKQQWRIKSEDLAGIG